MPLQTRVVIYKTNVETKLSNFLYGTRIKELQKYIRYLKKKVRAISNK